MILEFYITENCYNIGLQLLGHVQVVPHTERVVIAAAQHSGSLNVVRPAARAAQTAGERQPARPVNLHWRLIPDPKTQYGSLHFDAVQ